MAGLMMIFLFIAISYMNNVQIRAQQIRKIAVAYQELQDDLYEDLFREFKDDLQGWGAEIDKESLSVRFLVAQDHISIDFHEPEVLFEVGSAEVTPFFQKILTDFFSGTSRSWILRNTATV